MAVAGGAIAYHYMSQHARDPHYLLMLAPTLLTNHIMGRTKFRHTDFTPVGMVARIPMLLLVPADENVARVDQPPPEESSGAGGAIDLPCGRAVPALGIRGR